MSRTLIVGAGGFGREVYCWMQSHSDPVWAQTFAGYLDDNLAALANFQGYGPGVISTIADYKPQAGDRLVFGLADPLTKLQLAADLLARGAEFTTFIHSSALVVPNAIIGIGSVICPLTIVSCDVTLGSFVTINLHASVGHDARLGEGCTISGHCDITGKTRLGRGVFMGSHASVLPGVSVGDFARVGAGSVVIRNVRSQTTVMGVPAAKLNFSTESTSDSTNRAA